MVTLILYKVPLKTSPQCPVNYFPH